MNKSRTMGTSVDIIVTSELEEEEELEEKESLTNMEYDKLVKSTRFTEYEIVQLWNSFKQDFPSGKINRNQLTQLVRKVFPRCNDELVIENIFRIFDPDKTGSVSFNELLMAFSMSMRGSVEEKLKWAFKLYDKDGSGEIDREEMEDIFIKLCKISAGPSPISVERIKEKKEEDLKKQKQEETKQEDRKKDEKPKLKDKPKRPVLKKSKELETIVLFSNKHRKRGSLPELKIKNKPRPSPVPKQINSLRGIKKSMSVDRRNSEDNISTEEEVSSIPLDPRLEEFLKDPERDCTKFDVKLRASQLFDSLDEDGSGSIDQDEFIDGCMMDLVFVEVLDKFDGSGIWGSNSKK
ncbi:recoverin [Eurytemora carolleeae]|uniref:recoverin n=1 Tax=Eurytemora carolleeae TaxID=1294199 RepID=UPI000C7697A1|nr:recoverin [Eurytemora carolleeae]|eukprot:XP_023336831.1 recoverin-like [Eurytemora affinis]